MPVLKLIKTTQAMSLLRAQPSRAVVSLSTPFLIFVAVAFFGLNCQSDDPADVEDNCNSAGEEQGIC